MRGSREWRLLLDREDGVVPVPPVFSLNPPMAKDVRSLCSQEIYHEVGMGWTSRVSFLSHWKKGNCSSWG